jgi:hypothetical protein
MTSVLSLVTCEVDDYSECHVEVTCIDHLELEYADISV